MDVLKMITELRAERAALDEALLVLERLAASHGAKRRGRPPAWLQAVKTGSVSGMSESSGGKTRVFSAETRRKMALAQKKRWAAKKSDSGD